MASETTTVVAASPQGPPRSQKSGGKSIKRLKSYNGAPSTPAARKKDAGAAMWKTLRRSRTKAVQESRWRSKAQYELDEDAKKTKEPLSLETTRGLVKYVMDKANVALKRNSQYGVLLFRITLLFLLFALLYYQARVIVVNEVQSSVRYVTEQGLPEKSASGTRRFDELQMAVDWVQNYMVNPAWKDPVCGDGICELPFESPSYGRFGCQVDCGRSERTKTALLQMASDFRTKDVSSQALLDAASWNLCRDDPVRAAYGLDDLCVHGTDQSFPGISGVGVSSVTVEPGNWRLVVNGDYLGRTSGSMLLKDSASASRRSAAEQPVLSTVTSDTPWEMCRANSPSQKAVSRRRELGASRAAPVAPAQTQTPERRFLQGSCKDYVIEAGCSRNGCTAAQTFTVPKPYTKVFLSFGAYQTDFNSKSSENVEWVKVNGVGITWQGANNAIESKCYPGKQCRNSNDPVLNELFCCFGTCSGSSANNRVDVTNFVHESGFVKLSSKGGRGVGGFLTCKAKGYGYMVQWKLTVCGGAPAPPPSPPPSPPPWAPFPEPKCCDELNWPVSKKWDQSATMCAESDGILKCKRDMSFENANYYCKSFGARLCTMEEYAPQTQGTGCGFDDYVGWTSSKGNCPDGERMAVRSTANPAGKNKDATKNLILS